MRTFLTTAAAFLLLLTGACAQSFPPYYDISDHEKAQAEARERHLPLAWLGGFVSDFKVENPDRSSQAEVTQMALADLENQAVVIFFEGSNMGPVPAIVHAQDHIQDDGPLPGGASWNAPKIVFTNHQVTRVLGRVSETQLTAEREMAINSVLQRISQDPTALADIPEQAPPVEPAAPPAGLSTLMGALASASATTVQPGETSTAGLDSEDLDISPEERMFWAWLRKNGVYAGLGMIIFLTCGMALTKKD